MNIAVNFILLAHILKGIFFSLKNKFNISLILIGSISATTLLTMISLDSGKTIISLSIYALSIFLYFIYNKKNILNTKASRFGLILVVLFYIFFLGTYLYSDASSYSYGIWKLTQFTTLALLPSILILINGKLEKKEVIHIENFIIIACVITSLVLVIQNLFYNQSSLNSVWYNRQTIGDINVIWLGRFLSLGLLLLQVPRLESKTMVVYGLSAIILVGSLLTGSKIVLYITIPTVILYKFFNNQINIKKIRKSIVMVLFIVITLFLFLRNYNEDMIMLRFSLASNTVGQRLFLYKNSINAFLSGGIFETLFGNGGGTIGASLGFAYERVYPHNLLIEILYELGIFGFVLFISQLLYAILLFLKGKRNWTFFAYIMFFLFSLTSGDLVANNYIFLFYSLFLITNNVIE